MVMLSTRFHGILDEDHLGVQPRCGVDRGVGAGSRLVGSVKFATGIGVESHWSRLGP
jgi:hypothetical protein